MDDSYDELDIPDNWLDFGTKRRNKEPDFVIDKKFKSDTSIDKSPSSSRDDSIFIQESHNQNGLTDNIISVAHTSIIDENKPVPEEFLEKPKEEAHTPHAFSSPVSAPNDEGCVKEHEERSPNEFVGFIDEPESFRNSSNQSLPNISQRVEQQTSVVRSCSVTLKNSDSFTSNGTFKDDSLNEPELFFSDFKEHGNNQETTFIHSIDSFDNNVEKYTEHLSFTDDELRFISSEPGPTVPVENNNLPVQSSSNSEANQGIPLNDLTDKSGLKKISSLVRDAQIISSIVPDRDFNDIYDVLLDHRDNDNRLDIATAHLLEKGPSSEQTVTVDLFEEVQMVMSAVPTADANVVYTMLEGLPPSPKRVNKVIHYFNPDLGAINPSKKTPALKKKVSSIDDPNLKNDPIFRDMRTIARLFPETDRNEIYALLEASHDKSNRLQAVIEEIGNLRRIESQEVIIPEEDNIVLSAEDLLEQDIDVMKAIFPDCDPNFLYEKLESMKKAPNRTDLLATELFENKGYPRIKDIAEKAKAKEKEQEEFARMQKVTKLDLTVEEFLERFPEPEKTFGDESTQKSNLYQEHAHVALRNEFRMLKAGYLKVVLLKHKSHFYPAYQQLANELLTIPLDQRHKFMNKFMKYPRSYKVRMPLKADEYFYHEYWFVLNEQKVKDFPKQAEDARRIKIEEAKAKGELFECCCCYDDECLFEDLTSCPEGHLFCKTCVVRSTEAAFGEMKTKFPCLTGECEQNIPLSILQAVIPANLFSKIVSRMQEEEILQANISDLVSCPFCPFATIMPNPDDKVFKCLNPECLKESCRLCQEPNHIPLRCNEVEKKSETNMRTFIENRISEAVMRKCHKCGKNFVKEIGCNKMTCICGATSCYVCKKHNIGYDHFNNNKECADTDPNLIHKRDMESAAVKAKQDYLEMHPEAATIELKADVNDMINSYVSSSKDIKNIPM
ncbi:hypothetical protein EGW08_022329 [Elysia chlorotica]|uniref:RING-type domain-containing protein n=1 Tax=Elysia chlorotica TaxID=188477 RepID=A0A3S0Z9K3_ELYCH|nr:hypothetical protein EGW08_022329 [Elysia chlorotica]